MSDISVGLVVLALLLVVAYLVHLLISMRRRNQ